MSLERRCIAWSLLNFWSLSIFQKYGRRETFSILRTSWHIVEGFSALTLLTFLARQFIRWNYLEHHRMFSYIPDVCPLNTSSTSPLIVTTGFPTRNHPVENHYKRLSSSTAWLKWLLYVVEFGQCSYSCWACLLFLLLLLLLCPHN